MHSPVGIILVEAAAMRIDNASNIGIEGLTIGYPLADPLSEAIAATGRPPKRSKRREHSRRCHHCQRPRTYLVYYRSIPVATLIRKHARKTLRTVQIQI